VAGDEEAVDRGREPAVQSGPTHTAVDWTTINLASIKRSEAVAARIEMMITSGQLGPGHRLPSERDLASMLGVSRGLIREAIQELALKGLVSRKQGRGTDVREHHRSEFTAQIGGQLDREERATLELADFREAVEPAVAARAAERATPADVQRLLEILAAHEAEDDPDRAAELDIEFHLAIATAARNGALLTVIETALTALNHGRSAGRHTTPGYQKSLTKTRQAHRLIVRAIEARNAADAEQAMLDHTREIAANLARAPRAGVV
jgi:GntR family transcriptional regulator, transcriptional repressor for pyruvate dehydrogenase complex